MRIISLVSLFLILQSPAHTQTNTADGIDAYLRGDYQRAADILKPIAGRRGPQDPTAAFFMATLYDNGLGVPADAIRACALYIRASMPPNAPFAAAAGELLRRFHASMEREAFEICNMTASMGFDHRFEPVTFTLEPGHWIAWDLKGAVITYQGIETRVPVALAFNQPVFMPIRHTELLVDPTRSIRRHFMEVALWMPKNDLLTWALNWRLFEVDRNELITIATEQLTTFSGSEPPLDTVDLRDLVQLRVNEAGGAEWALSSGTPPEVHVIQSAAEREAAARQARERQIRESKVDWARVQDVHRRPSLRYVDADGCGQIIVNGWSEDRAEAISIKADQRLLQLSTVPRKFDLSARSNGLDVALLVYERAVRQSPMCSDVAMPQGSNATETWRATSGVVTIQLQEATDPSRSPVKRYAATVQIVGAEFVSSSGQRVRQGLPITLTATVGWFSG